MSRLAMLPPIRPNPIIPTCIPPLPPAVRDSTTEYNVSAFGIPGWRRRVVPSADFHDRVAAAGTQEGVARVTKTAGGVSEFTDTR